MLIMNTNEFLITRLVGSECVVEYSIYYRIFALGSTVFSLALTPIWSAVTKAIAEKDVRWVNSLYKKMLLLGAAGTFCEFLAVPILQFLINIWLQDKAISVNYGYAIAFAFMGSAMIFNGVLSSIANGLGKIKTQAVMFTVGMVLKIALSYVLVGWLGSWIGVLIANAAALAFYCVVEPWSLRKHLKHLSEQTAQE
jgi:O-antigen/teichoic acid export membrane protein